MIKEVLTGSELRCALVVETPPNYKRTMDEPVPETPAQSCSPMTLWPTTKPAVYDTANNKAQGEVAAKAADMEDMEDQIKALQTTLAVQSTTLADLSGQLMLNSC